MQIDEDRTRELLEKIEPKVLAFFARMAARESPSIAFSVMANLAAAMIATAAIKFENQKGTGGAEESMKGFLEEVASCVYEFRQQAEKRPH